MCDAWKNSFEQFYKDMGSRPAGYSIERKNNDGDYEPDNCIWADAETQARNRRSCRFVNILKQSVHVKDAEKILGIYRSGINQKVRQTGMTYQSATNHFIVRKLSRDIATVEKSAFYLIGALASINRKVA